MYSIYNKYTRNMRESETKNKIVKQTNTNIDIIGEEATRRTKNKKETKKKKTNEQTKENKTITK